MSLIDRAVRQGMNAAKRLAGREVTYSGKRGNATFSVVVKKAIAGTSTHEASDASGMLTTFVTRAELIDVCDLRIDDTYYEPQAGDVITEQVGPQTRVYKVTMPAGQDAWSYSDAARTRYRIYTQQVG